MKKLLLFATVLMVSVCSFAEWVKPANPQVSPMALGEELYLFNKEAGGFLVGANDWGTRASVSPTLGHKVYIEAGTVDGSYYISNYVLEGGMKDQIGYMFMDNLDNIWVDNTKDGKTENQYSFESQGDGTYRIGLSPANLEVNPTNYPGAYLGLIPNAEKEDTRLYMCDPENSLGYQMSDCKLTWYFVAPDAYEAYTTAMKQYIAAVALGEVLAEAETVQGVDADVLAAAQAAYGNAGSTPETLDAQRKALEQAVLTAKLNVASLDNPVEMLASQGIATDFNSGAAEWSSTTNAQNKGADNGNNAKDYSVTKNHYENWNWDAMSVGKVSATAKDLPTGVYRLNALAFANVTGYTYLFAGQSQKLVTSTNIDVDQEMELYAFTSDGTMSVGLDVQTKSANWIGLDNVYLYYVGASAESYQRLIDETMAGEPDYEALLAEGEAYCQKSLYEDYTAAKGNFLTANSTESMTAAYPVFTAASKAMAASVAAYSVYAALVDEANEFRATTTSESDEVTLLADYIDDETAAEGLYNGNGGAMYILAEGLLDNEKIVAEAAYLERILKDAKANAKADGDDCTDLLKNPNFAEMGGWTSVVGPVWPAGNQSTFPVVEVQNMLCDVYQELTNLQNGLYEFSLQGVYRAEQNYADEYEDKSQAYAYINSFEAKIPSGKADNINSGDEASAAFAEGKYPVTVYGLVTDGTMKVGITNRLRTADGCYLWAGGAKLTFRAKNEEVLAQVISETLPKATALQSSYAGQPELTALADAIDEASSPEDAYAALIALKDAMDAVNASATSYANLAVALKSLSEAIENNTTAGVITIRNAQNVLDEAQAAYEEQSYNAEEAEQAVSNVKTAYAAVMRGGEIATEENPVDYSSMIVNNNFDPAKGSKDEQRIDGWVTSPMNGYKQYTASYNRAAIDLYQRLSGLPKGKYKVTVHTYYRAGYWDEEEARINNNEETHLTTLYAETSAEKFTKPVMNLTEGADADNLGMNCYTLSSGLFAPDGTTPTAAWFAAGRYLNELVFTVPEDGEVTIGLSKTEVLANDYEVVGEWKLWYMGDPEESKVDTVDVTYLIVNNNFDPEKGSKDEQRIDGWVTSPMNGYKQYTASYNRAAIDLSQKLSGLSKGKYKVTVHTYYRAGYWDEEEARIANNEETHLTTLYAETSAKKFTTPVMNLTEGADADNLGVNCYTLSSGLFAPDGTTPTAAWFAAGRYLNELEFTVPEDGEVTIGLSKTEVLANDYEVVGAWNLYYMGDPEESKIDTVDVSYLIVNNNFDPEKGSKDEQRIDGWVTSPMNGYKQFTASYNRAAIDLYQDLSGLEPGKYCLTVHTYYRAGYWDEEEARINNNEETHLTTLYAETSAKKFTTPVMNLSEGANADNLGVNCYTLGSGLYAPDGTTPTAAWFAAGRYLNKIDFIVPEDGKVRIGLSKTEVLANDYEVVGEWNLYYLGQPEGFTENDVTYLITNPNFDPEKGNKDEQRIDGWVTSPMNGYKQFTASYNRAAIDLYQNLSGLEEGTYKVTVHTYYRAGYYDEEEARINNSEETHLTTLYAQTSDKKYSVPVMNLTEGADADNLGVNCYTLNSGLFAPDGTTPTAAWFAAGRYLNELMFYVGSDGKATIGLSKTEVLANDYEVVGAWNLYYYGPGNNVDEIATEITETENVPVAVTPVAFYSLSGTPLAAPVPGINIVKMSDGSVRKVFVK